VCPGAADEPRHLLHFMKTPSGESTHSDLSALLVRIVVDPRRTEHLHGLLGWYCHETRNILNSLKMCIYLVKRENGGVAVGGLADLEPRYGDLERFVDRLHQLCRPMPLCRVRAPFDLLIHERCMVWSQILGARGRRLRLKGPADPAMCSFDPTRLGTALDDLVAWRARCGRRDSDLFVSWGTDAARESIEVAWTETPVDPGADRTRVSRSDEESDVPEALAILSLPMLTRVVTLHGGTVEASERAGWQLRMRWPTNA
jgi:hypothetical protein